MLAHARGSQEMHHNNCYDIFRMQSQKQCLYQTNRQARRHVVAAAETRQSSISIESSASAEHYLDLAAKRTPYGRSPLLESAEDDGLDVPLVPMRHIRRP